MIIKSFDDLNLDYIFKIPFHPPGKTICDNDTNILVIPLSNSACTTDTLKHIVTYCENHINDTPWDPSSRFDDFEEDEYDLEEARLQESICFWDNEFLNKVAKRNTPNEHTWDADKREKFYDLMVAAHYLAIESLVETGGKWIAKQVKGKNPDVVREILGMTANPEVNQVVNQGANNVREGAV